MARIPIANLKGPRGIPGPQGPASAEGLLTNEAIAVNLTVPGEARDALNAGMLVEQGVALNNRTLWACTDSFGTTAPYGLVPYPTRIAETNGMTRVDNAAGGSFFRDIAMRSLASPPSLTKQDTVLIAAGINPARHRGVSAVEMEAELDALETLIWRACAGITIGTDEFTWTGTWSRYTAEPHAAQTTNGYARAGAAGATSGSFTTAIPGYYVGLGYSSVDFNFHSGEWARGDTVVAADESADVLATTNNTSVLVPRPVRLGNLRAGETVKVTHRGGVQYTLVDGLMALLVDTPLIVVVEPAYVLAGSSNEMNATPGNVNQWRSAINRRIADMRKFHPKLRVVVVSPVDNGWNVGTMVGADGLHPDEDGVAFLHKLTTLSASEAARNLPPVPFVPRVVQAYRAADIALTGSGSWQDWPVDSSYRNDWNALAGGGVLVDAAGVYTLDAQVRLSVPAAVAVEIAVWNGSESVAQTVIDPGSSVGRITATLPLAAGTLKVRVLSPNNVTVKGGGAAGWSRASITQIA